MVQDPRAGKREELLPKTWRARAGAVNGTLRESLDDEGHQIGDQTHFHLKS